MSKTILAIETSCDETACAIVRDEKLLSNVVATQIDVHAKYGGVMPEIASRLHAENISIVISEALQKAEVKLEEVDGFAFTRGPGLIGALHVGMQAAKTLAMIYNKPLIPVHHLAGHIYANEFVGELKFPLLAVIVSGGNTELVIMEKDLDFKIIGRTKDDAVGECFDKVARVLGLPYPGGIPIDKLAKEGKHTYKLPSPLHDKSYDFSYSGLKTNVINLVHKIEQNGAKVNVNDMCRSFQDVAIDMIIDKSIRAAKDFGVRQVVLAGGVSANSYLRKRMEEETRKLNLEIIIPPMWCCTDNAAMIAKVGSRLYDEKLFASLDISVDPNWEIEDYDKFEI